jgi:hypothetical protein
MYTSSVFLFSTRVKAEFEIEGLPKSKAESQHRQCAPAPLRLYRPKPKADTFFLGMPLELTTRSGDVATKFLKTQQVLSLKFHLQVQYSIACNL